MRVDVNWFPRWVFGVGLTQSIITLLKGSLITGIGSKVAGGMIWFALSTNWYITHDLQNSETNKNET